MYGTGREKLFKDQGFYSQDLHVCYLEINEYFKILTTSFECLHQIYIHLYVYIYIYIHTNVKEESCNSEFHALSDHQTKNSV